MFPIIRGMVQADVLAASGHSLKALIEVTNVYAAGIKVIDAQQD